MAFTCFRCGGSFWQKGDYRAVTALADRMIARGEVEAAHEMAQRAVREGERHRK